MKIPLKKRKLNPKTTIDCLFEREERKNLPSVKRRERNRRSLEIFLEKKKNFFGLYSQIIKKQVSPFTDIDGGKR